MAMNIGIFKEGWVMREEDAEGSMATWRKRYFVLSMQQLRCYKHDKATEPISSVSVASVEEMAFGQIDENKNFAFSLTTPRGIIRLASNSEEERESWVTTLRNLVPKAKVELAKEMLMRKARRKAVLELAQQQIKEAIDSIMSDSRRVAVRGGFKMYADVLSDFFRDLLRSVDKVANDGVGNAKMCSKAISSIVDSANSTAAVCTNRAIQEEIVIRTRDIAIETANMLGYATTAAQDPGALAKEQECIVSIQEQVKEILELLAAAGQLEQELDDAKSVIEEALIGGHSGGDSGMRSGTSAEASVDALTEKAKMLSTQIKNIAQNATLQPERVGEYSKAAGRLMCELLEATSVVAAASGVDISDPEYLAGAGDISEHQRQQLESMLAAAKGFAAATTNMIDLLRQIPQQEDDEALRYRLTMATRSADNALNAFVGVTQNLDTEGLSNSRNTMREPMSPSAMSSTGASRSMNTMSNEPIDYSAFADAYGADGGEVDAEMELLAALEAIESSVAKLGLEASGSAGYGAGSSGANGPANGAFGGNQGGAGAGGRGRPGTILSYKAPSFDTEGGNVSQAVMNAARRMGEVTGQLVAAAAAAQKEMKESSEYSDVYRKDPNWTRGLAASAQSVAETTNMLMEVAISENATPEDIVAAVRCVNGATARLVAFCRAKGDQNSESQRQLDRAAKAIAQATNQLVNSAKVQKMSENNAEIDAKLDALRTAPRTQQIKHEFEAQARIAKLETDLDAARQYLFKLRRAVYGNSPGSGGASAGGAAAGAGGAVSAAKAATAGGRASPSVAPRSAAPAPGGPNRPPRPAGSVAGGAPTPGPRAPAPAPRGGAARGGLAPRGAPAPRGRQ